MDADRLLAKGDTEITLVRRCGVVFASLRENVRLSQWETPGWVTTKTASGPTIAEALKNLEVA